MGLLRSRYLTWYYCSMQKTRHQGKTLRYVTIFPDEYDPEELYPLIVLLHGFGSSMHDLAGLAPSIDPKGYIYTCPNGPVPVPIGPGMTGYAWTRHPGSRSPEAAEAAEAALMVFIEEVMELYHIKPGQLLLGGFSQGGMMTYQAGLARPSLFGGLAALSSCIEDPSSLLGRLPQKRDQPIFIAHGTRDSIINVESARQSLVFLQTHGYLPSYNEYDMDHEITSDVVEALVSWIRETLPPAH